MNSLAIIELIIFYIFIVIMSYIVYKKDLDYKTFTNRDKIVGIFGSVTLIFPIAFIIIYWMLFTVSSAEWLTDKIFAFPGKLQTWLAKEAKW